MGWYAAAYCGGQCTAQGCAFPDLCCLFHMLGLTKLVSCRSAPNVTIALCLMIAGPTVLQVAAQPARGTQLERALEKIIVHQSWRH